MSQLGLRVADPCGVLEIDVAATAARSVGTGWRHLLGCDGPPFDCHLMFDVDIEHIDSGGLTGGDADQTARPSAPEPFDFVGIDRGNPEPFLRLLAWLARSVFGVPSARKDGPNLRLRARRSGRAVPLSPQPASAGWKPPLKA